MDFGHLVFDPPGGGDSALATPEFDFYDTFLQTGEANGGVGSGHLSGYQYSQQQQQQQQQHQQHHHQQHRRIQTDDDLDDDMEYLTSEESAASAVSGSGLLSTAYSLASSGAMVPSSARAYVYPPGTALARPSSIVPTHAASARVSRRTVTATVTAVAGGSSLPTPTLLRSKTAGRRASVSTARKRSDELLSAPSPASLSRRLERRGHTKSRRGCFNCKRRRIKCQETRPACGHCVKTGLQCEYPATPLVNHQPQHLIPLFSLQDMRFFQHFLVHCCPHHPLDNETLWTHEIPCLSHNYDFLMHALLGLAASDLMQRDASLAAAAMDHRLKAIRAMKRALSSVSRQRTPPAALCADGPAASCSSTARSRSKPKSKPAASSASSSSASPSFSSRTASHPPSTTAWDEGASGTGNPLFEEGNALMAACFALTFQSVELDDGMVEYMTFIRGILLVAIQMHVRGARLLFRNLLSNEQTEMLRPALEPLSPIERQWGEAAVAAVQALGPLCRGDDMAASYQALVLQMASALLVSPVESYTAMTRHYGWWMQLPYEQFRQIIDLEQPVFLLLATHWIALKQIMVRITDVENAYAGRVEEDTRPASGSSHGGGGMDVGIFRWLKHLNRQVEADYLPYNKWPMWVEAQLDGDLGAFRRE